MKKVSIVVLGDIGRSPRMQYHALSLCKEGYFVNLIGYKGSNLITDLATTNNVKVTHVKECPDFKKHLSATLAYFLKAIWQSVTLLLALMLAGIPDFVLVQNPPAIPSLGVCYIFSRITRATLIIDWHNYAYSILALSLGFEHSLVRLCKRFEFWFGQRSDLNVCVTRAMKDDLYNNYGIVATTLYDRPLESFRDITLEEKHTLLRKLGQSYKAFSRDCTAKETVFTKEDFDGSLSLRQDRPALLISSTSWTEDEDFSILLEALQDYEDAIKGGKKNLPRLFVVITGKGPQKEFYVEVMARRQWKYIDFITPWLAADDYPKFLACGDLGVSLHYSSSGLDLPMKVVDMFGCGLPVCAINFSCLGELVVHKENGLVFEDSTELSEQLQDWFKGFPEALEEQKWRVQMRKNLEGFRQLRWHENWQLHVGPLFK